MSKNKLKIDTGEAYELAAKGMVRSLLLLLRESLIEAKVSPRKQRQICESFCVDLCDHLDQGWFRVDGQTFYPLLRSLGIFWMSIQICKKLSQSCSSIRAI